MLKTPEHIQDNVHGRIELTELEHHICKSPTFSRLRRIEQLGLASVLFPSASHTRASHSIGTLCVMGKLLPRLDLDDAEVENLRLAALLHDIGQYPLSHVIESVYRVIGEPHLEAVENASELLDAIQVTELPDDWLKAVSWSKIPRGRKYATDKHLSREVIQNRPDLGSIFARHGISQDRINLIASIATGDNTSIFYQQLLDSAYDCDRLDYTLRDATQTGVRYGQIDLDYLIENMSKMKDPPVDGDRVLAIDRKRALHTIEQYLSGRYFMQSQIIHHKTIKAAELLARAIYYQLARQRRVWASFEDIKEKIQTPEFLMFNDVYFYNSLYKYYMEVARPDKISELIHRLLFWDSPEEPLPLVNEWRFVWDRDAGGDVQYGKVTGLLYSSRQLGALCKEVGIDPAAIVVEEIPVDLLPIGSQLSVDNFQKVLSEEKDHEIRRSPRLREENSDEPRLLISERSSILHVLGQVELRIIRVFALADDTKVTQLRKLLEEETKVP